MGRILLIDDDIQVQKMLRQKLERKGHDVVVASDGNAALTMFRENPTDLIVTDLIMPEKDGVETISELRKEFPDIKIIAISGGGRVSSSIYLEIAKTMGANYIFSKPLDMDKMFDAIDTLLA